MRVKLIYSGYKTLDHNGHSLLNLHANIREILVDSIIMNSDARIEMSSDAMYVPEGNGTEVAMLRFLQDNDISVQDLLSKKSRESEHECQIPFSPHRKRMTTVIRPYKGCNYVRVVVKGAPEYVMNYCTKVLTQDGETVDLDENERQRILDEEIIGNFARKSGFRTFVYAYKDIDSDEWEDLQRENNNFARESDREIVENDLTFVAGFGIQDDFREGVVTAIGQLRMAGINTRIISGDHLETAIHCAKKAGILAEGEEKIPMRCMTGNDFRKQIGKITKGIQDGKEKWIIQDKKKFREVAENLKVLARSTPEDKFSFVVGLQDIGTSVAVTADGINDAGALKHSHVGFCMGISGCEVAKDAADIIILDDNFQSVYRATQWGRNILDNIRKFIQFQLTINIVCVFMVLLGGATLGNSPFSVIQLLWINMIMDTLAAISLATEPPHPTNLKQDKQKKTDRIIMPVMWRNILTQAAYQLVVLIVMLYSVPYWFGIQYGSYVNTDFYEDSAVSSQMTQHYTIVFNTFVLMNLFNQINCRKLGWSEINIFDNFFNNIYFFIIVAGEFAAQYFIVQIGGDVFRTEALDWRMHLTCYMFGLGSLLVSLGCKYIPEQHQAFFAFKLNENEGNEGNDFASRITNVLTHKVHKSETMKLLDSN